MQISTRVTRLLEIEHPILLAPMGSVSGGALARAVSAAGGLGIIGGGYGDADWLKRAFEQAGNARVGCGFITWSLAQRPQLLDQVLAHSPIAVMLSFGDPAPFSARIKAAGAKLICQVQTLEHAKQAVGAGADIIVAQGGEAGGHGLSRSTMTLVPAVAAEFPDVPVVAAGGIADGRGLAAALMLGAEAVLVGTRFYAAQESEGHDHARQRILEATGDDTVRTSVFDIVRGISWPEQFTGRALRNPFWERWAEHEDDLAKNVDSEGVRFDEARARGDFDMAMVFAGEAVGLIHDLPPAGEIVERMVREARARLAHGAALVRS